MRDGEREREGNDPLKLSFLERVSETDTLKTDEEMRYVSTMNTSNFFVRLWHHLYGGEFVANRRSDVYDHLEGRRRGFSPDIRKKTSLGTIVEEVKASSRRGTMFHCSEHQVGNYADFLLRSVVGGDELPEVNYVFIKYGERKDSNRLYKLTLPALSERMAGMRKEVIVIPLNLLFFISLFSKHETRKQISSGSSWNSQDYFYPSGTLLSFLSQEENAVQSLTEVYNSYKGVFRYIRSRNEIRRSRFMDYLEEGEGLKRLDPFEELFLEGLKVERTESRKTSAFYLGKTYEIEPFPVTKYFLPQELHREWLAYFSQNHKRILSSLGFEDIFAERLNAERRKQELKRLGELYLEAEKEDSNRNREYLRREEESRLEDDIPF